MLAFARRCTKEILRDPATIFFGLGFPLILLLLLSTLQKNIPTPLFEINDLAPGICVFALSFFSLFAATLVAKDRESAFLQRLYTTPLTAADFILGYTLPLLPLALLQSLLCLLASIPLGLSVGVNTLFALISIFPIALLHISLGLLCGSMLNAKQVGGICGALLTNLTAWLSGIWFDLSLIGGLFEKIATALPFYHAVELAKTLQHGNYAAVALHLLSPIFSAFLITGLSIFCFLRQMQRL